MFNKLVNLSIVVSLLAIASDRLEAQPFDTIDILVRGDGSSIDRKISETYAALYNTSTLPVRKVVGSGKGIEKILTENKVISDSTIDVVLASIMCDLNSHVCSRNLSISDDEDRISVGGFMPSSPIWAENTGQIEYLIPAAKLVPKLGWDIAILDGTRSVEEVVLNEYKGCQSWDDSCRNLIASRNRKYDSDDLGESLTGSLSVPVSGAIISMPSYQAADGSNDQSLVLRRDAEVIELRKWANITEYGETYQILKPAVSALHDPSVVSNPALKESIKSKGFLEKKMLEQSIQIERKEINIIKHSMELPPSVWMDKDWKRVEDDFHRSINFLRLGEAYENQAKVAIIDGWVDDKHCAFTNSVDAGKFVSNNWLAPKIPNSKKNCNTNESSKRDIDHGTWVAGIIAGNSSNFVGLNPNGYLATYQIPESSQTKLASKNGANLELPEKQEKNQDKPRFGSLEEIIDDAREEKLVDVINMSFGYSISSVEQERMLRRKAVGGSLHGMVDGVQKKILELTNSALVVASAGNSGMNTSLICDVRPSCFNFDNLISVASMDMLNGEPSLQRIDEKNLLTNYGENVHLAAPGVNVFSTISGGRYGTMSGTSQAAPIVSAVASLYMAKHRRQTPLQTKNRLIYCSSGIKYVYTKLFGGFLNAECVLDTKGSFLILNDGDAQKQYGSLVLDDPEIAFYNIKTGVRTQISRKSIRSINRIDDSPRFVVYYTEDPSEDSKLLKISDVKIDGDAVLSFLSTSGETSSIQQEQLFRYVWSDPTLKK